MKALLGVLVASASIYGGAQLAETLVPASSEHLAFIQGMNISTAAFIESEMGTTSWEEALKATVGDTLRNDGQLTVTGTTLRWDNGIDVWCIELPDPYATVRPVRCA